MQTHALTSLLASIGVFLGRCVAPTSNEDELRLSCRPSRADPERKAFIRALGRRQGIRAAKLERRRLREAQLDIRS